MKVGFFSAHQFEKESLQDANIDNHNLVFFPVELNRKTVKLAEGLEAVSLFVNDDASANVLKELSSLGISLILLRSAGFNHVDLNEAKRLNIAVANVPEYSPYAVAEHALALMLALNRKIVRAHSRIRELNFSLDGLTGFDFHGKTIGIAGFGKIGQKLANIMLGMGCKVLAYDLTANESYEAIGVQFVTFKELCSNSDVISLHLPLTSDTKYIINKESISWMKQDVMLINTGRGGLINTKAVIKALKKQKIGYLGLDVYEEEQNLFFEDHSDDMILDDQIARLMTFQNVLITSHQGFLTHTALRNIADTTFKNLDCYLNNMKNENFIIFNDEKLTC